MNTWMRRTTVTLVLAFGLVSLPGSALASPITTASTLSSSNDFGVTLVNMFAFIGDMLSFFQDEAAADAYLPSACVQPC